MCARIESTCLVTNLHLVHAKMVKTSPKKGQKEFFIHSTRVNYPSFNEKKVSHLTILLKICKFLRELGNETFTFYHLYTFQFKKLQRFLNKI